MKVKLKKVKTNEGNIDLLLCWSVLVLLTMKKNPHSTEIKFKTSKKVAKFEQNWSTPSKNAQAQNTAESF